MLAGIEKALEYEDDWTRLEDGVLECGLRDQFDGEQTGLARIIVDDGKVSVAAWSDNPHEYKTMPEPDWTHEDRKSTRLNSSHSGQSRMPSSA